MRAQPEEFVHIFVQRKEQLQLFLEHMVQVHLVVVWCVSVTSLCEGDIIENTWGENVE